MGGHVKIMEVGPRDGLQNESRLVDTATKIAFIEGLVQAGLKRVEMTSFVSPRWIPPLADQVEVALGVQKMAGISYAALVPNMKGYENARAAHVEEVAFVIAATDSHNRKNLNASTKEVLARYQELAARAKQEAVPFRIYLSCAMGCPFEGEVAISKVVALASDLEKLGPYELSIGDTIGIGHPVQCRDLLKALKAEMSLETVALHLHDTRGMALANIYAAVCEGVRSFDASAGGLGGCPYAPGASGNVATEDVVYMLDHMGLETGVDLDSLCALSLKMEKYLGHQLPSKILALYRASATKKSVV